MTRTMYTTLILHRGDGSSKLDGAAIWKIEGPYKFLELEVGQPYRTIDRMNAEAIIIESDSKGLWLAQLTVIRTMDPDIRVMLYDEGALLDGDQLTAAINAGVQACVEDTTHLVSILDKWFNISSTVLSMSLFN